jgi:hypothetical protein
MRHYRRIWIAVFVLATAVGVTAGLALADLPTVIAGALLCGFVATLLAAVTVSVFEHQRRLRAIATGGAAAAIGWIALLGLVELAGPGALGLVVLLGVAGLIPLVRSMRANARVGLGPPLLLNRSDTELQAQLAALTLPELCAGWRTGALAPVETEDPRRRARLVQLRGIYLDELERRDPAGFAEWLKHDALGTDPEGYLGRGHNAAA